MRVPGWVNRRRRRRREAHASRDVLPVHRFRAAWRKPLCATPVRAPPGREYPNARIARRRPGRRSCNQLQERRPAPTLPIATCNQLQERPATSMAGGGTGSDAARHAAPRRLRRPRDAAAGRPRRGLWRPRSPPSRRRAQHAGAGPGRRGAGQRRHDRGPPAQHRRERRRRPRQRHGPRPGGHERAHLPATPLGRALARPGGPHRDERSQPGVAHAGAGAGQRRHVAHLAAGREHDQRGRVRLRLLLPRRRRRPEPPPLDRPQPQRALRRARPRRAEPDRPRRRRLLRRQLRPLPRPARGARLGHRPDHRHDSRRTAASC